MVHSRLELVQTQSPNTLPRCVTALALGMTGYEMKNNSFSGLDLLERPLRSALPLKAMSVSAVPAAVPGHVET